MAPKASQRSSLVSQKSKVQAKDILEKLSRCIMKKKKKGGTIKDTTTVTTLNEALQTCRKQEIILDTSYINDLVTALETDDDDACSMLEPSLFSIIVRAVLQTEQCLKGERIMYLCAASLLRDTNLAKRQATSAGIASRKSSIGKGCLLPAMEYFLNQEKPTTLRRWVGILCIQLVRGCDDNVERLELSGEDARRNIGHFILKDSSELIRIICGQLVKTLNDAGVELHKLWPHGADTSIYEAFPLSAEPQTWTSNFEKYIDRLYTHESGMVPSSGGLVSVSSAELAPVHTLGVSHQNMFVLLEDGTLHLLAALSPITTGQILDVPTALIKQVRITAQNLSQTQFAKVVFEIAHSGGGPHLDGKVVHLREMIVNVTQTSMKVVEEALQKYCPDVAVSMIDESEIRNSTNSDDQYGTSQRSTGVAEVISQMPEDSDPEIQVTISQKSQRNSKKEAAPGSMKTSLTDGNAISDSDAVRVVDTMIAHSSAVEESVSKHSQTQSRRGKVKPKAKPPIIPGSSRKEVKATPSERTMAKSPLEANAKTPASNVPVKGGKVPSQKSLQVQMKAVVKSNSTSKGDMSTQLTTEPNNSSVPAQQQPAVEKGKGTRERDQSAAKKTLSSSSKGHSHYAAIDSDSITTPEPQDASTPKMMPPPAKIVSMNAQMMTPKRNPTSQIRVKKRFNLHGAKPSTPQQSGGDDTVFDVPQDEDGEVVASVGGKKKSAKPKQPSKNAILGSTAVKTATSKVKPARKSAPAALQQSKASPRHSQRTAAAKAKTKLIDMSDDDEEIKDVEVAKEANNPDPVQKSRLKAADRMQVSQSVQESTEKVVDRDPKPMSTPVLKDEVVVEHSRTASGTTSQQVGTLMDVDGQEAPEQQRETPAASPHPVQPTHEAEDYEDLYSATPLKSQKQVNQGSIKSSLATAPTVFAKQAATDSNIDMASKLDNAFGDLDAAEVSMTSAARVENAIQIPNAGIPQSHKIEYTTHTVAALGQESAVEEDWPKSPIAHPPEFLSSPVVALQLLVPPAENNCTIMSGALVMQQGDKEYSPSEAASIEPIVGSLVGNINTTANEASKSDLAPIKICVTNDGKASSTVVVASEAIEKVEKVGKKRKVDEGEDYTSKRRKSEEQEALNPNRDTQAKISTKGKPAKKARPSKPKSASPTRRSPRLEMAKKAAEEAIQEKPLVDEKVHRKPPIISFGTQGPRNQGRASAQKSNAEVIEAARHPKASSQDIDTESGQKRKRGQADLTDHAVPPRKRLESSPLQDAYCEVQEVEEIEQVIVDFTPAPDLNDRSEPSRPKLLSKPSSQGSRVDVNGSPLAPTSTRVDHMSKLERRFAQGKAIDAVSPEDNMNLGEVNWTTQSRPRSISDAFGPRVTLSSRAKALPSSPEEVTTRYIAHEKTDNGQYTGIATREVIADEKVLPNPFAGETRKSSSFTDRLLASAVEEGRQARSNLMNGGSRAPQDDPMEDSVYELTKSHRETSKVHVPQEKNKRPERRSRNSGIDPEQTLINSKYRHVNNLSELSDMTYQSETSDSSRQPLSERPTPNTEWNVALRPHYRSLNDAVHRIADEVIIRLSDEEDRMELMVEQYRENGTKIVDSLTKNRTDERLAILKGLNGKKEEMANIYTEAKDLIQETTDDLKENQVNRFEKMWRKQQDEVRKQISEGRNISK